MADHGELLTKFERKFGSVVEHEVIKLILQTSGWDSRVATETLMGMIDENDLPAHIRHSLGAEMMLWNAVTDGPGERTATCMNDTRPHQENGSVAVDSQKSAASDFPELADGISLAFHGGNCEASYPPSSPARSNVVASSSDHEQQTASWILASEFVPRNQPTCDSNGTHSPKTDWSKHNQFSAKSQKTKVKMSKKGKILETILSGDSLLLLMRGLPGSGKTTLARELKGDKGLILSTDDFFCDKQGRYNYNPDDIGRAHQWNRHRTEQRLQEGRTPIIVDNTNLQQWELKPYVQLALQYGYKVDVLDADTPWKLNPTELARKNIHGVPKKKIIEMKDRYQNIDIEKVIASIFGTQTYTESDAREDTPGHREVLISPAQEDTPGCREVISPAQEGIPGHSEVISPAQEDTPGHSELMYPAEGKLSLENLNLTDDVALGRPSQILDGFLEYCSSDDDADVVIEDESENLLNYISGVVASETQQAEKAKEVTDVPFSSQEEQNANGNGSTAGQTSETDMKVGVDVEDNVIADQGTSQADPDGKVGDRTVQELGNMLPAKSPETVTADPVPYQSQEEGICQEIKNKVLSGQVPQDSAISVQDEADWGEAATQVSAEMSDEVFSGLVKSFGSALKLEIEKNHVTPESRCSSHERMNSSGDTANLDDSIMYEFLKSMEETTGKLQSSTIKECTESDSLGSDMFVLVNGCDDTKKTKDMTDKSEKLAGGVDDGTDNVNDKTETQQTAATVTHGNISHNTAIDIHVPDKEESKFADCTPEDSEPRNDNMYMTGIESVSAVAPDKPAAGELATAQPSPGEEKPTVHSLVSWECVDINTGISSMNWNSSERKSDKSPKPTRTRRQRTPGDPTKWLTEQQEEPDKDSDPLLASWNPVEVGSTPEWGSSETSSGNNQSGSPRRGEGMDGGSPGRAVHLTGAVPKSKNRRRASRSKCDTNASENTQHIEKTAAFPNHAPSLENVDKANAETQTLSIDFEALENDNNLYELKILYGTPNYNPHITAKIAFLESGPLTKGKLKLDKGTITDSAADVTVVRPLQNLIDFFPSIPEDDLKDVMEKCRYDVDWAMNVLLDGGYEMSDPVQRTNSEDPAVENVETGSASETASTGGDANYDPSFADVSDISSDILAEEKIAVRQSLQADHLKTKKAIEQSFSLGNSVSDTVTRLTGKDVNELNSTRIKEARLKKQGGKKNTASPKNGQSSEESSGGNGAVSGAGAQYITLVMDSLFASQLTRIFGPVGSCEISGDLTQEDRSVILPLEFCHMIHKYWAKSLDGKFKHEAEVLDSMIREDENLARRLQEEEENEASTKTRNNRDSLDKTLEVDPPTGFQEIMDIQQAVHNSKDKKSPSDLSSRLNLQRLYAEYPHVDKGALNEEFELCEFNYSTTVERLTERYGSEQGTPKNVIAPEVLYRYEQQMIEQAERNNLARDEAVEEVELLGDIPDDPQVYRDEAQIHYLQRQEAYRKAQEAARQGMKAVAAYYARSGNIHSVKMKEANDRASKKILEATNANKNANCLDLHHLHIPEALNATQAFLAERYRVLTAYEMKQMQVSIITGRGARSIGGQARLKPAIKEFLQKNGYGFHEANSGKLNVMLKS